jgi:hypothetical protein
MRPISSTQGQGTRLLSRTKSARGRCRGKETPQDASRNGDEARASKRQHSRTSTKGFHDVSALGYLVLVREWFRGYRNPRISVFEHSA